MEAHIIIFIVLFIVVAIFVIIFSIMFFWKKNIRDKYETILFFLEIDLKKWRIRKNNLKWNENLENEEFNSYFKKKIGNGWINISDFFEIVGKNSELKWKRAIDYCIRNKSTTSFVSDIDFKSIDEKKIITYTFNLKFWYSNENTINVEVKSIDQKINVNLYKKIIDKEKLLKSNFRYNLFVGFGLINKKNKNETNSNSNFVSNIIKTLGIKNISFFKSSERVIFVYRSKMYFKIKRVKRKIEKRLNKSFTKNDNSSNFYNCSTIVECENLRTENDLSKVMTRISFGLIKSKLNNRLINFDFNNIKFNEFEQYKEKIMKISKYIESKRFQNDIVNVKSIKTSNHLYNAYFPNVNLSDDYFNKHIIKENNFDNKIIDNYSKYVLKNTFISPKKILLFINDYKILDLFDLIKKNKNVICIVRQVKLNDVSDIESTLNLLNHANIRFGIFVENFDSNTFSIIQNCKPELIVINETFNKKLEPNETQDKLKNREIISIIENLDIKLVFTNLSNQIKKDIRANSTKDKLSLEYKSPIYII